MKMAKFYVIAAAACTSASNGGLICGDSLPHGEPALAKFFDIAFALLGAVAFLMVVIGGLRYITGSAQNNPTSVSEAKKMIIYSVVGMVVAASAAAIVNFALGSAK